MNQNNNNDFNNYYYNNICVPFQFKRTDTGETTILDVPTDICTKNFIEFVKNNIYDRLNIDTNLHIEIVEAGQGGPNMRSEDAPALQGDFNTTVRQRYNGVYENIAFYIRILQ